MIRLTEEERLLERAEGKQEGLQEGIQKGEEKERIKIAKKLLMNVVSIKKFFW